MNNNTTNSQSGSTFLQYCYNLNIALIVLRLCGVIDWSWIWIMSPLWMPLILLLFAFILGAIAGGD